MTAVMEHNGDPSKTKHSALLDEYVRKADLARVFGVSDRTIERWVRLQLLPAPTKLGRTALFHIPTVKKALANGGVGPRPRGRRR